LVWIIHLSYRREPTSLDSGEPTNEQRNISYRSYHIYWPVRKTVGICSDRLGSYDIGSLENQLINREMMLIARLIFTDP
jgi:hypothetical protein